MDLLERDEALAQLTAAHARAREGRGCVVLVGGEAGIGKSVLVGRFAESLDDVSWGRCDSLLTPRVLGPAYEIAERRGGRLQDSMLGAANRSALFTAFLEEARTAAAPVFIFEDLHWADEATLDLVKYLARRIAGTRLTLVLTYRDDEIGERHPLRLVVGELPASSTVRVALRTFSLQAIAQLAGPDHDAKALAEKTCGNPFYVTEVLANPAVALPASVRDAVLARAARLSPAARTVLDLASIEPGGIEPAFVATCLPGSETALAECEASGVLVVVDGLLRFRHEIARLAVRDALGVTASAALHRKALAGLRERASRDAGRLAHHAEGAGEGAAVLEYAMAAARRSAELGGHREAADHYERALRFATGLDARARGALLDDLAQECQLTGRLERSLVLREECIALWRAQGDRAAQAMALARTAGLLVISGRNAESHARIGEARSAIAGLPPSAAHAVVHRHHAALLMLERDVREAVVEGEKAIALAERFGDADTAIGAHNTIGAALLVDDDERGVAYLERSLELARQHGSDSQVVMAFVNLGSGFGEVNRFHQARGHIDAGLEHAIANDLDYARLYLLAWRALVDLHQGRWLEAGTAAQDVIAHPLAHPTGRMMAWIALGRLRARRGDPGTWNALDTALSLSEATRTLQRLAPARAARAEAAWLEGEPGAAAREAAAVYELALAKGHAWFAGELAYWQWKGGRLDEAPAIAARPYALQIAGAWREAAEEWRARGCIYEAARALAEGDVAAQLEALASFESLGARPAAARLRQALRGAGVRRIPRGPRATTRSNPQGLTPRELEILGGLAENLTNAEIAARLHISAKTVDHHVGAVLGKLGLRSRRDAARTAAELGLLEK